MFQRSPIALAQVKATNTFENLLNKTHQIVYSFYQVKGSTKKVDNNIMNSIKKLYNRTDAVFMNYKNSKIFWDL